MTGTRAIPWVQGFRVQGSGFRIQGNTSPAGASPRGSAERRTQPRARALPWLPCRRSRGSAAACTRSSPLPSHHALPACFPSGCSPGPCSASRTNLPWTLCGAARRSGATCDTRVAPYSLPTDRPSRCLHRASGHPAWRHGRSCGARSGVRSMAPCFCPSGCFGRLRGLCVCGEEGIWVGGRYGQRPSCNSAGGRA